MWWWPLLPFGFVRAGASPLHFFLFFPRFIFWARVKIWARRSLVGLAKFLATGDRPGVNESEVQQSTKSSQFARKTEQIPLKNGTIEHTVRFFPQKKLDKLYKSKHTIPVYE
jgi:hypothetical protein